MARIPKKADNKIRHRSYLYAYLWVKNGIYYAVIHDKRKSLHIKEGKTIAERNSARKLAMDKLDELVFLHLQKTNNSIAYVAAKEEVVTPPPMLPPKPKKVIAAQINRKKKTTIIDLVQEYVAVKKKQIAPTTLKPLVATLKKYFTKDYDIEEYHEIRKMIVKNHEQFNYVESTAYKQHQRLYAFFDWTVKAGYATRNPMDAVPAPRVPQKDVVFPTWEEFNAVVEHYQSASAHKNYRNEREYNVRFWRVLAMTGMRIGEAVSLTLDDFTDEGFVIDGKRKYHKEERKRWFLYAAVPGTKELMQECIKHAQPDGRLWPWQSYQNPAFHWRNTVRELGMNEEYSPHSLRRLAKWWWEVELRLPAHLCNLLAGHGFAVRNKYHRSPTLGDLSAYLGDEK